MTDQAFVEVLARAVAGDHDAITVILEQYAPLIQHYSSINGILDEDCRQFIHIEVAIKTMKFVI